MNQPMGECIDMSDLYAQREHWDDYEEGTTRIVLLSPDSLVRGGIAALLKHHCDIRIVGEAWNQQEAERLGDQLKPDLFIYDTPTIDDRVLRRVHNLEMCGRSTPVPVLVLTVSETNLDAPTLQSGSCVLLRNETDDRALVAAIRLMAAGYLLVKRELGISLASTVERVKVRSAHVEDLLTKREREVYELLIQGLSNPEIAQALTVANSTVKSHVQDILAKLGLRNRAEAIVDAYAERGPSRSGGY
jgi:DNA-binding NarL/FixJ family response regulator